MPPPAVHAQPAAPRAPTYAYAGFWRRFVAWVIDLALLLVANLILAFIVTFFFFLGLELGRQQLNQAQLTPPNLAFLVIRLLLVWLYFAGLESSAWQATIGKRWMRLSVTDRHGRRISFGRATGRYFSKVVSWLILFVGFLAVALLADVALAVVVGAGVTADSGLFLLAFAASMAAALATVVTFAVIPLTPRKQAFHDLITGSLVARRQYPSVSTLAGQSLTSPLQSRPGGASEVQRPNV